MEKSRPVAELLARWVNAVARLRLGGPRPDRLDRAGSLPGSRGAALRPFLFGLMLLASLGVLAANFQERRGQVVVAREPLETAAADVSARIAIVDPGSPRAVAGSRTSRVALQTAIRRYRQLLRSHPQSQTIPRRIGILIGVVEGPEAAWKWFQAHPEGAYTEVWRAAYAPDTLSGSNPGAALRRLDTLRLAWYGELVRAQLYRKAGQDAQARATTERLRARLRPGVMRLISFISLGLIALPLGVLLWVAAFAGYRRGVLRPVGASLPLAWVARPALLEGFIAWFFTMTVGGWSVGRALAASGILRERLPIEGVLGLILATQVAAAVAGGALLILGRTQRAHGISAGDGQSGGAERSGAVGDAPEPGMRRGRIADEISYGVLAYLAAVPLLVLTAGVFSRLLPNAPTPPNPAMTLASRAHGPWEWLLLFLVAAVAAPLFEELFFRGALYGALRRRAGAGVAVAGSSVAFALVHPQLPLGFFPILVLGIVFAIVVELRRSLVPSIVAHLINNSVALLLMGVVRTP